MKEEIPIPQSTQIDCSINLSIQSYLVNYQMLIYCYKINPKPLNLENLI